MSQKDLIEFVTTEIAQSKGYKHIGVETIRRVVLELLPKYSQKQLLKEAKNKLHQIWGAFFNGNPSYDKIVAKFQEQKNDKIQTHQSLNQIAQLHSSTKERQGILPDLYEKIFQITGKIESVVEYGCGLNSLCLVLSGFEKKLKYIGYDIDQNEVEFLNQIFQILEIHQLFTAKYGDIFTQDLVQADVAFLLKLLPTIEQQKKGIALEILIRLPNKWIVISFPVFSIGQKRKKMTEFYTKWFEELVTKLEFKVEVSKVMFETELVFVVQRL